jgi:hypothetical protein
VLQAYVDDSASEKDSSRRLFLAAYINTPDCWARFSVAWKEKLDAAPSIKYLKMSQANSLSGEFAGWSVAAKDDKIKGLSRVIRHFNPMSIHASISRAEHEAILKPKAPYGFTPYLLCFQAIIIPLANYQAQFSTGLVTDFIFDEQEIQGEDALWAYEYIRETQPKPIRDLLGARPIFADDKTVYPLQAADLLAWHVRRQAETGNTKAFQVPSSLSTGYHMASDIDAEWLQRSADGLGLIKGVENLKTKGEWRAAMKEIHRLEAAGVKRPYRAQRWRNTVSYMRNRIVRMFAAR